MEDGRWKMEDGRWKMEDGRWKMEDGRWEMEDGRWKMGVVKLGWVVKLDRGNKLSMIQLNHVISQLVEMSPARNVEC